MTNQNANIYNVSRYGMNAFEIYGNGEHGILEFTVESGKGWAIASVSDKSTVDPDSLPPDVLEKCRVCVQAIYTLHHEGAWEMACYVFRDCTEFTFNQVTEEETAKCNL